MPSLASIVTTKRLTKTKRRLMKMKTIMERFLDEFLKDYSYEEIFEMLDLDLYDTIEVAFEEGLIDEELVERYL
jgi:ATP-dependent protease ClpP protease subunit